MPKLINTHTRIADEGKPRVIVIGGGFGGLEVMKAIIGFKNKFFVLLSWLWSYFSYDESNRLIIARPKNGVQ